MYASPIRRLLSPKKEHHQYLGSASVNMSAKTTLDLPATVINQPNSCLDHYSSISSFENSAALCPFLRESCPIDLSNTKSLVC